MGLSFKFNQLARRPVTIHTLEGPIVITVFRDNTGKQVVDINAPATCTILREGQKPRPRTAFADEARDL